MYYFTLFCDWYVNTVYPQISDGLGRLTDRLPFSLGEILMYAGAVWILILLVQTIFWPFLRKHSYVRRSHTRGLRLKESYSRRMHRRWKRAGRAAVIMIFLYIVTWVIPFFSSYISFPEMEGKGYTVAEVTGLRNWVIEGLNEAAQAAQRDAEGHLVVPETVDADIVEAMHAIEGEFPRLTGYYPRLKKALCTDFLQWMRIGGFTYPYTMELMGNGYDMLRLYYPCLYAHESSHHQGYYQEDEADFLSYIACSSSDDPYVRYSAFYQMYYVVEPEFRRRVKEISGSQEEYQAYISEQPAVDPVFREDLLYDQEIFEKAYRDSLIHPPEKLKEISGKVADVGWSVQADVLQEKNYGGSLGLLLQYFYRARGGAF